MPWNAIADNDTVDTGTVIQIELGYSDTVPQNGEVVEVILGATGRTTSLTVVSAAADQLETTDGRRNFALKPYAVKKPTILDDDGHYRDAWVVG